MTGPPTVEIASTIEMRRVGARVEVGQTPLPSCEINGLKRAPRLDAFAEGRQTEDAIEDHNEIRDTGHAVDDHPVGSDAWFTAVDACNKANSKHMAEEEREGLTDFRRHTDATVRHQLAVQFAAFEADYADGVEIMDKDPKAYVAEHSREPTEQGS